MAQERAAATATVDETEPVTRAQRRAHNRREHRETKEREQAASGKPRRNALDPAVAATLEDRRRALRGVSGGAYYRVNRAHPIPPENQGKPEFLSVFDESDEIDDLKVFFRQLALASHWGNGRYLLEACAKGQRGIVLWTEDISLGDLPEVTGAHAGGGGSVADQITQVGQVVSAVKGITGEGAGSADAMARLFTAGVAAGKGPDTTSPMLALLMPVIGKVVERLMAPPPAPPPHEDSLDRTLLLMERLGFRRPEPTPTGLAQISEAMNTARAVVDAAGGLAGTGTTRGAESSVSGWVAWAQTFQVIAPILGQAISQLTTSVNNVVDARKLEHLTRSANARTVSAPVNTSPFAGFEHAITEGIHTPEVFSAIATAIAAAGHGGLVEAVRAGTVNAEMILTQAAPALPELSLPGAPEFVEAFVAWCRVAPATTFTGPPTKMITAECTKCHARGPVPEHTQLSLLACQTLVVGADGAQRLCGGPVVRVV